MSDLRIIDIAPLRQGTPAQRQTVAAAIGKACREIGFFYISNAGITPTQMHATFAASRTFFAQPESVKAAMSMPRIGNNRGYVGIEGERLDTSVPPDLKEAFNLGLELPDDHPDIVAARPFRGRNAWPALPGWRDTMQAYYDACCDTARVLHRAFALDLGMPEGHFAPMLDAPIATLRLLHYPPAPASVAAGQSGAGTHTDYGNVTILATDGVAGLQVQRRDGVWLDAPAVPDAFVCNIGDMLMRWSNDIYVSTPHRVALPTRDRYSIAFFFEPEPDAVVAVLPSCMAAGEAPKYPPVTCAAFLASRLAPTYAHVTAQAAD